MGAIISFFVPGCPIAQPRIKARGVFARGRVFARVYEPGGKTSPVRQWKSDLQAEAYKHVNGSLLAGPLALKATFFFPRPQRLNRSKDPVGPIPYDVKPDIENVLKALMDSMTGIIYNDDRQIASICVEKFFARKGGDPGTRVEISEIQRKQA